MKENIIYPEGKYITSISEDKIKIAKYQYLLKSYKKDDKLYIETNQCWGHYKYISYLTFILNNKDDKEFYYEGEIKIENNNDKKDIFKVKGKCNKFDIEFTNVIVYDTYTGNTKGRSYKSLFEKYNIIINERNETI